MIRTIRPYLIIFITLFLLTSCASISNSTFQKATIKTVEKSTVLVDGRKPKMKDEKDLIIRDTIAKEINKVDKYPIVNQNYVDTLSIVKKSGILYLSKQNLELRATFRGSGAPKVSAFLKAVEDVPKFQKYVKSNINLGRVDFANNIIGAYNHYKLTEGTEELNQDYFNRFGLITKKEYRKGPRQEILKTKQPITGEIKQLIVTTTHYTNSVFTRSTTGENFKFKFKYGNTTYKKGFLLKNLKMAIGDDKEALKHIKKYRANWIARQSLKVFAIAATGFALMVADDQKPFGISSESTALIAIPLTGIFTWAFMPQRYKTKNITNTINTYNQNLK